MNRTYTPEELTACKPADWAQQHAKAARDPEQWQTREANERAAEQFALCAEVIRRQADLLARMQAQLNHAMRDVPGQGMTLDGGTLA